jgi:hypothetical protein
MDGGGKGLDGARGAGETAGVTRLAFVIIVLGWRPGFADAPAPVAAAAIPLPDPVAGHYGQLGAVGRAEIDAVSGDVGPAFGVTMGLGSRLELETLVVSEPGTGLRLAWSFFFCPDASLKPLLRAGSAFVGRGGTHAGLHGGAGVVWDLTSAIGLGAEAAIERYFELPETYDATVWLMSIGAELRTPR